MGKTTLGLIAGVIVAFVIISLNENITSSIHPVPEGMNMNDIESVKAYINTMPITAFLAILLGYTVASFVGAFTATYISKIMRHSFIVAFILMLANTANLVMIPHPVWFAIASSLIYPPFAWMGGKSAMAMQKKNQ
jgi:hypothetical protein